MRPGGTVVLLSGGVESTTLLASLAAAHPRPPIHPRWLCTPTPDRAPPGKRGAAVANERHRTDRIDTHGAGERAKSPSNVDGLGPIGFGGGGSSEEDAALNAAQGRCR